MSRDIIEDLKKGDKKAFKGVFDSYFNALCAFGNKYIIDIHAVEDMIQEVFVNFWENRQNFENINSIKAFLYTSVRNKCLNHIKHQVVRQKSEKDLQQELESEQFFNNSVLEEEIFNQLYNEIKNLPGSAQKIMLLALNGLKNPEIADELQISINTVKTQKKIAYNKLKNKLGHWVYLIFLSL